MRGLPVACLVATLLAACSRERDPEPLPPPPGWSRLANGLRVRVLPVPGAKSVAVLTLFSIGGDHDPAGRAGLAHFAEHLFVTCATGAEGARTVQDIQAQYTDGWIARTFHRSTVVGMVVAPGRLDEALEDAAARMRELRIEQADLDRERPRVLAEVGREQGAGLRALLDFMRTRPQAGQSGGRPQDLGEVTVREVAERCGKHYKPVNAWLVLAGDVEPGAALALVEKRFGSLPAGERVPSPAGQEPLRAGEWQVPKREGGALTLLASPAPSAAERDFPAYLVLLVRVMPTALLGRKSATYRHDFAPVWFEPLDEGRATVFLCSSDALEPAAVGERFDERIAEAAARDPSSEDIDSVHLFLPMLGLGPKSAEPDPVLTQAFRVARSAQAGFDPEGFDRALRAVTADDLKRVAAEYLSAARRGVLHQKAK